MVLRVEYINNNGYLIETNKAVYVFDFVDGFLPATYLRKNKPLIFFVTNNDKEHYSQSIYSYRKTVVFSYDIPQEPYNKVFKLYPNEMLHLGFAKVYTRPTTRDGLVYIIKEDDKTFIHAGNLNNYHYQEFSSEKRVELETQNFNACLNDLLEFENPDVLIFPLNPHIGFNYEYGAKRSVRLLKPKHFFPTQFRRLNEINNFINFSETEKKTQFHFPKFNNQEFMIND